MNQHRVVSEDRRYEHNSRPAAAAPSDKRDLGLFATTTGRGPNILLLHGWGLHSAVWDGLMPHLASRWRITRIDLPGHGRSSADLDLRDLDAVCAQLHEVISDQSICVGWSLGGLIAAFYAIRYPRFVSRLILIASQPRFTRATDWPHALPGSMLRDFSATFDRDHQLALRRFLALQAQGSDNGRATLQRLHAVLNAHSPDRVSLRAGLDLLRETDLRAELPNVTCPARLLVGEMDKLVPAESGAATAALFKNSRYKIISRAGHAPFLSHPLACMQTLETFLDD